MKISDVWPSGFSGVDFTYGFYESAITVTGEEFSANHDQVLCGLLFTDEEPAKATMHAINMHDELVEALEQTAIELHNCIQAINQYKAKEVSSLDLDAPDYHDFQTVHESMLLVKKAKS